MYKDTNLIYIFTILEAIEKIKIYIQNFTDDEAFYQANDQMNFNAVVSLLIAIGEENKKIDSKIKSDFEFNWNDISKMRDKISHNYRGINPYMVWDIVKNPLKKYRELLISILSKVDDFNKALSDALESNFYLHLGYLRR